VLAKSLATFSAASFWVAANWFGALLGGSIVYYFTTRVMGLLPWRLGKFVRMLRKTGVLLKESRDRDYRLFHARMFDYLENKSRFINREWRVQDD
jgi:hypothetical protein